MTSLDTQAVQLNNAIQEANPAVLSLLSDRGKAIFFPKLGILSQAAEAKGKDINATIGIATEDDGSPLVLKCIADNVSLPAGKSFTYAPSPGTPDIRKQWKKMQIEKNPKLQDVVYSNPVVTNALTHGLSIAGYLFLDPGDKVIIPDQYWENYDLTFGIAYGSQMDTFPTFTPQGGFNVKGLEQKLQGPTGKKVVSLNFPNNPTGYTPTTGEVEQITAVLKAAAEAGNQLVVIIDDAYFGLVFEEGIATQSVFANICNVHPNLLAVKADGPTKEDYVWGFRIGFLSFGVQGGSSALYQALEAKAGGAIRGTISNASHLSQSLLLAAWESEDYNSQRQEKYNTLKERYDTIKGIFANHPEYAEVFKPLPYNSGYFMCIQLNRGQAEPVRQKLLSEYSTGVIAFGSLIRVAFSCTPASRLEQLFNNIYNAARG